MPGGNRERTFFLFAGTHVYGGFAGHETQLSERDPVAHPVVLCGDLLGDDAPAFENRDDNSYHVVTAGTFLMPTQSVRLDGFWIRGGEVSDPGLSGISSQGGGLLLHGEVEIVGCTIHDNRAGYGGGIYFRGERLHLAHCRVIGNSASAGGGVSCSSISSVPLASTGAK